MKIKTVVKAGDKFNRLTAIEARGSDKSGHAIWLWKCDCGVCKEIDRYSVVSGKTRSCGCYQHECNLTGDKRRMHGGCGTRLYREWKSIKRRCYTPNTKDWVDYGGRGIAVCDEWLHDFEAFRTWALEQGYTDELTIERIDVDGNYEPSNCSWITPRQQALNKRNTRLINYQGESKTLGEWAILFNLPVSTLRTRYYQFGWRGDKLFQPKTRR